MVKTNQNKIVLSLKPKDIDNLRVVMEKKRYKPYERQKCILFLIFDAKMRLK